MLLILAIDSNDIIVELKRIANGATAADRVASQLFEEMINGYATNATTASLDDLAAFTVTAKDITNATSVLKENDKFVHVLARLKTDERLLHIFEVFLQKVTNAKAIVADVGAGSSALQILCNDKRDPNTNAEGGYPIIANLVKAADITDIAKIDKNEDMKHMMKAVFDHGAPDDLVKVVKNANDTVINRVVDFCGNFPEKMKPAFMAAYSKFDDQRQFEARSALLHYSIEKGADAILALVTEADQWGVKDGFAVDNYQLTSEMNGIYKGKFLYVTAMRMAECYTAGTKGFTLELMHKISGLVKEALKAANYQNHVTVELNMNADNTTNETLFNGLQDLNLTKERVIYVLQLDEENSVLSEADVYAAVARMDTDEDRNILAWLYGSAIKTENKANALAKINDDGYYFIEALTKAEVTD